MITTIFGTLSLIIKFWDEVQQFVAMRNAGKLTNWLQEQRALEKSVEGAKTDAERAELAKKLSDSFQSMP